MTRCIAVVPNRPQYIRAAIPAGPSAVVAVKSLTHHRNKFNTALGIEAEGFCVLR